MPASSSLSCCCPLPAEDTANTGNPYRSLALSVLTSFASDDALVVSRNSSCMAGAAMPFTVGGVDLLRPMIALRCRAALLLPAGLAEARMDQFYFVPPRRTGGWRRGGDRDPVLPSKDSGAANVGSLVWADSGNVLWGEIVSAVCTLASPATQRDAYPPPACGAALHA